jgi:tetratricopeptide (TPR) repeat protein
MTFNNVADLLNTLLISVGTLIVILVVVQVFFVTSKSKALRFIVLTFFVLLSAGVVFGRYYASSAPARLASVAPTDPVAAVKGYTAAIRLAPDDSELYFRRAMNHFRLQQYAESQRDLDVALAESPNNGKYLAKRAVVHLFQRDAKAARTDAEAAVKLGYETPELLMVQGITAMATKQYAAAIGFYTKALSGDLNSRNHCFALINRSHAYQLKYDFNTALADLNTALRDCTSESDHEDLLVDRGTAFDLMHETELALKDWEAAEQIDPNDAVIFKNRGGMMIELGRFEDALANFNRYVQIRPNDPFGYTKQAEIQQHLGRPALAKLAEAKADSLRKSGRAVTYQSMIFIDQYVPAHEI